MISLTSSTVHGSSPSRTGKDLAIAATSCSDMVTSIDRHQGSWGTQDFAKRSTLLHD